MKIKPILILIILVAIFFLTISFLKIYGDNMKITKEKAIAIANNEGIRLGYDINVMNIRITKYTTPWNDYLPKDSKSEYIIERQNKVKNKEYWAVYYGPKEMQLGGDLCIFVDAKTGEIITVLRGK